MCHEVLPQRQVADGSMGAVFVVTDEPFGGRPTDVVEILEDVAVEDLGPVVAVKALDISVPVGLAGLDEAQFDGVVTRPALEIAGDELRPLSMRTMAGGPRISMSSVSALKIRRAGRLVSISLRNASQLKLSSTLNVRKPRSFHSVSTIGQRSISPESNSGRFWIACRQAILVLRLDSYEGGTPPSFGNPTRHGHEQAKPETSVPEPHPWAPRERSVSRTTDTGTQRRFGCFSFARSSF